MAFETACDDRQILFLTVLPIVQAAYLGNRTATRDEEEVCEALPGVVRRRDVKSDKIQPDLADVVTRTVHHQIADPTTVLQNSSHPFVFLVFLEPSHKNVTLLAVLLLSACM